MNYSFPSDFENLTVQHEKILLESEKILGKKGLSGLELKNIASYLKVAPSTINYYYSTGEELIFDTVLFSYGKYVDAITQESAKLTDPEKILKVWIKNTFNWTTQLPGVGVILEFPRQVIKVNKSKASNYEDMLRVFSKNTSAIGIKNVTFLCSSIRALQKNQDFKLYKPAQIALLIAKDQKFATFCSTIGFATLGGGLWVAGRQPDSKRSPAWAKLGFNPQKQMNDSISGMIKLVKNS